MHQLWSRSWSSSLSLSSPFQGLGLWPVRLHSVHLLDFPHLFNLWDYIRRRSSEYISPVSGNVLNVSCSYQYLQLREWRIVLHLGKQSSLVQPLTDLKWAISADVCLFLKALKHLRLPDEAISNYSEVEAISENVRESNENVKRHVQNKYCRWHRHWQEHGSGNPSVNF
jgi:hypothetical protein